MSDYEDDFIIVGDDLLSSALAYMLSLSSKRYSVTLVNSTPTFLKRYLFSPAIIRPLYELENFSNKTLMQSQQLLQELYSLTESFDFYPLPFIFFFKNDLELFNYVQHKFSLEQIQYSSLNSNSLIKEYPLLNIETNSKAIVVPNSWSCSDPHNLILTYKKLAEENNVYIYKTQKEISFDLKSESLLINGNSFNAKNTFFITNPSTFEGVETNSTETLLLTTPIIEFFPKIGLKNCSSSLELWLEQTGHLHLYKELRNDLRKEDMLTEINGEFLELFPDISELRIMDNLLIPTLTKKSVKRLPTTLSSKVSYSYLPLNMETTIAPSFARQLVETLNANQGRLPSFWSF